MRVDLEKPGKGTESLPLPRYFILSDKYTVRGIFHAYISSLAPSLVPDTSSNSILDTLMSNSLLNRNFQNGSLNSHPANPLLPPSPPPG